MDFPLLTRITRLVSRTTARRETVRGLAAALTAGLGFAEIDARKKRRKKRCRQRLQSCGGKKKCCNTTGFEQCQTVTGAFKPSCAGFTANVCCGSDGASCDPNLNSCDCCANLFCVTYAAGSLCRSEET